MTDAGLSACAAAQAIARGELKAERYVGALLGRARALDHLHAFLCLGAEESLLESARAVDLARGKGSRLGPLAGIPLGVKDNVDVAGFGTTAAHRALGHRPAAETARAVARLLQAGGLVLGKTNLHELALGATNNNTFFPAARNPFDPDRSPGGSSGGTAVAVAAGMVPVGIGTDTGASCRVPASLCGVVGFRPSITEQGKRYPDHGVVPLSTTRDTVGTMATTVDDILLLDSVISGETSQPEAASLKGLRLGVPRAEFWHSLDPEVQSVCEEALRLLADHGAELVEARLPGFDELKSGLGRNILFGEFAGAMAAYLASAQPEVRLEDIFEGGANPDVCQALAAIRRFPRESYVEALTVHRPALRRMYAAYFRDNGLAAMVYPTARMAAPLLRPGGSSLADSFSQGSVTVNEFEALTGNAMSMTNAGLCGVSVPAGMTASGLPVGLEFDALPGHDRQLLGVARAFEAALGRVPGR